MKNDQIASVISEISHNSTDDEGGDVTSIKADDW